MASESSAVIQFIADNQRRPVDRGIFSRKYVPPQPVLLTTVPAPWKARLTIAASLLVAGIATGLYASQTDAGRGFIASLTSSQAELAAAEPSPPAPPSPAPPTLAAAIAPCPPAAPAPAAVPVVAVAASVPAAPTPTPTPTPAPAAAVATPKPRPHREGTLRIRSTPACDILVDGHRTGLRTPQRSLELKPGTHTITLVNKKQKIRSTFSVRIKDGKTTRVSKHLRRSKKH